MSLQGLDVLAVGSLPKKIGFLGSLISINAVPSSNPDRTYSLPELGSVQPQLSFADSLLNFESGMCAKRS